MVTEQPSRAAKQIAKLHAQEKLLPDFTDGQDVAIKETLVAAEPKLYWQNAEIELSQAVEWLQGHVEYREWGDYLRWLEMLGFQNDILKFAEKLKARYPRRVALKWELDQFPTTEGESKKNEGDAAGIWQWVEKNDWRNKIPNAIVDRGFDYYHSDAVLSLSSDDDYRHFIDFDANDPKMYRATVRGNSDEDYDVIVLAYDQKFAMTCTCPWAGKGNICKHEVATLLAMEKYEPTTPIKQKRRKPKLAERQKAKAVHIKTENEPEIKRIRNFNERNKNFYIKAMAQDTANAISGGEISDANTIIATENARQFLDDAMQMSVWCKWDKEIDIYSAVVDEMMKAYHLSNDVPSNIVKCIFGALDGIERVVGYLDGDDKLGRWTFNYLLNWQKKNEFMAVRCIDIATKFATLTKKQVKIVLSAISEQAERLKDHKEAKNYAPYIATIKMSLAKHHFAHHDYLTYLEELGGSDIKCAFWYVDALLEDGNFALASHELDKIAWRTKEYDDDEPILARRLIVAKNTDDAGQYYALAKELIAKCSVNMVDYLRAMHSMLTENSWREDFLPNVLPELVKGKVEKLNETFNHEEPLRELIRFSETAGGLKTADLAYHEMMAYSSRRVVDYYLDEIGRLIQDPTTRKNGDWIQYLRRLRASGCTDAVKKFVDKMLVVYADDGKAVKELKGI